MLGIMRIAGYRKFLNDFTFLLQAGQGVGLQQRA
jgi:hypothetical protein